MRRLLSRSLPPRRATLLPLLLALTATLQPASASEAPRALTGTLLVADLRDDALLLIDVARPQEAPRRIPLPAAPHELLALPDGRIVASLERGGALAVLAPAAERVEMVEVGGIPHGLAWDGRLLLVTDREAGSLRRFDPEDWSEHGPLPAPGWPHAVAASDGHVAVTSAHGDALLLDGAPLAVSALPETVDAAAGLFATAGALGGRVHVFTTVGTTAGEWTLGGRPVRLRFAPDGTTLAVALSADRSVVLLDPRDPAALPRRVEVGGVPDGLVFDATGRRLFVSDLVAGRVSVVDVAGGRVADVLDLAPHGVQSTGSLLLLP